jgi:hypothetical protein
MKKRKFLYTSGMSLGIILSPKINLISNPILSENQLQEGDQSYYPFLYLPLSETDNGGRFGGIGNGPDSPSIWFEKYEPSGTQNPPIDILRIDQEYQIAVKVKNRGKAPAYTLCIDFLQWTSISVVNGVTINYYTFIGIASTNTLDTILMDGEENTFRSTKWVPLPSPKGNVGDFIIRVYDPTSDQLTEYGDHFLYVQGDRHLGHHSYQIA